MPNSAHMIDTPTIPKLWHISSKINGSFEPPVSHEISFVYSKYENRNMHKLPSEVEIIRYLFLSFLFLFTDSCLSIFYFLNLTLR